MDIIKTLSTRIGFEWYQLGLELGFLSSQLEHLQNSYQNSIPQCIATLLDNWVEVVTSENVDPMPIIATALTDIGRNDLAEDFKSTDEVDGLIKNTGGTKITEKLTKIRFGRKPSSSIQKYIDQSTYYLDQKLKTKHLHVHTRASQEVFNWYQRNHSVVVIGNPGDGKSSIACRLLSTLQSDGYTVVVLSDPALIEQVYDQNLQIVYFIDDAFGSPTMKNSLVDVWKRLHDKLQGLILAKKCGLIVTSRKLVYKKCSKLFYGCPTYTDNIVDITEEHLTLTAVEKNMIAARYFHEAGKQLLANNLKFTDATYIPGFPLLCKMYSTHKGLQRQSDFFDKPLTYMKEEMEALIYTDKACLCSLVIMTVLDGKLPKDIFDPFEEMDDTLRRKIDTVMKAYGLDPSKDLPVIESSIENMLGVYVEEQNELFVFIHNVIFDTICLIFGQKSPSEVLRIASAEFISKRIRTQHAAKITEEKDVIVLPKNKNKLLAKRWVQDLKDMHISAVYDNPSFLDKYMFDSFIEEVEKLSSDELWKLMTTKDSKRGKPYIKLVCQAGFEYVVINMLERLSNTEYPKLTPQEQDIIDLSLYGAVEKGYFGVTESLLKLDVANFNQTFGTLRHRCIHIAVINGDHAMTELLLRYKVALNTGDSCGVKPIHYACKSGSVKCLRALIDHGAKLLSYDSNGKQPTHFAASADNLDCLEFLHKQEADLNVSDFSGNCPVHFAAENECTKILAYLLKQGIDPNISNSKLLAPMHFACRRGIVKNVQLLLKHGVDAKLPDIHGNSALHSACKGNNEGKFNGFACVKLLLSIQENVNTRNKDSVTPLHEACKWPGDQAFDVVKLLLERGADPNVEDDSNNCPLLLACTAGSYRTVKLLLEYKADPNVKGVKGKYPIHFASARGSPDLLELLIGSGADKGIMDVEGKQPIHVTCQYGNDKCTEFLLTAGVSVNVTDVDNRTPLHVACKWSKASSVCLLIQYGADPGIRTNDGRTAEDMLPQWNIKSRSCNRIKQYLRETKSVQMK